MVTKTTKYIPKQEYFNQAPKELIEFDQWVNWREVPKDKDKFGKIPLKPFEHLNPNEGANASVNDPSTWGMFSDAYNSVGRAFATGKHPGFGIGFVITANDPIYCIDIDAPASNMSDSNKKIRQQFMNEILTSGTYIEVSPSGKGFHAFFTGYLDPDWGDSHEFRSLNIEIYSGRRFMTITGNIMPGAGISLVDDSELAQKLFEPLLRKSELEEAGNLDDTESGGRRLNLTDEEVIAAAVAINKRVANLLAFNDVNDWSDDLNSLVGDFDKVCGSSRQIYNIITRSDFVLRAGVDAKLVDRFGKLNRTWVGMMRKIRISNDKVLLARQEQRHLADMGRKLVENLGEGPLVAEQDLTSGNNDNVENLIKEQRESTGLSRASMTFLSDAKIELTSYEMRYPPGLMGLLCQDVAASSKKVNPTVVLETAFAVVSGLISRGMKNSDGDGPIIMTGLFGDPTIGKGTVIKGAKRLLKNSVASARARFPVAFMSNDYRSGTNRIWIHEATPASIQAHFDETVRHGAGVCFMDEATDYLSRVFNPPAHDKSGAARFYKDMFDKSTYEAKSAADVSRAGKAIGAREYYNVAQSYVWSANHDVADSLSNSSIKNGLITRLLLHFITDGTERIKTFKQRREFTPEVRNVIEQFIKHAEGMQQLYDAWNDYGDYKRLPPKFKAEATEIKKPLIKPEHIGITYLFPEYITDEIEVDMENIDRVMTDISNGVSDLPSDYIGLGRAFRIALRYFELLSLVNHFNEGFRFQGGPDYAEWNATVRDARYIILYPDVNLWRWCLSHVCRTQLLFIDKLNSGLIGKSSGLIIEAAMKTWLKRWGNSKDGGRLILGTRRKAVKQYDFIRAFRDLKEAKVENRDGQLVRNEEFATMMLDRLVDRGVFDRIENASLSKHGTPVGYSPTVLCVGSHDCWITTK